MLLIAFQVNGPGFAAGRPGFSASAPLAERLKQFRFGFIASLGILRKRGRNLGLTKVGPAAKSGEVALFGVYRNLASGVVMPGGVLGSILAPAVFAVRLLSVSLATSRCEVASFYLGRQLFAGTWSPFTLRPRSRSSSRTFCCIASSVRFMTQRK